MQKILHMNRNIIFYLIPVSIIFLIAALPHFTATYQALMPPFIPFPNELIIITGIAEIIFALGIWWKAYRRILGKAMIVLLLLFLILHFYHVFLIAIGEKVPTLEHVPNWVFWMRIPLQIPIIYWVNSISKLE